MGRNNHVAVGAAGLQPPVARDGRWRGHDPDCHRGVRDGRGHIAGGALPLLRVPPLEPDRVLTVDDPQSEVTGTHSVGLGGVRVGNPQRGTVTPSDDEFPAVP